MAWRPDIVVHDTTGRCMPPHASSLELLGQLRSPADGTSFLDVGCGSGCQSVLFAPDTATVEGFDPGARQVSFARANAVLNGVTATYTVDRWETFAPAEGFAHVAFNTPGRADRVRVRQRRPGQGARPVRAGAGLAAERTHGRRS
jgi:ribosomal protein L11 methylase PrmA